MYRVIWSKVSVKQLSFMKKGLWALIFFRVLRMTLRSELSIRFEVASDLSVESVPSLDGKFYESV